MIRKLSMCHLQGWVNCCIPHYLLYAVTAKCCSCIQQNQKRIFSYIFVKIALKLALKTVWKNRAALFNCQLSSSNGANSKNSGSVQTTSDDMPITFSKLYLTKSWSSNLSAFRFALRLLWTILCLEKARSTHASDITYLTHISYITQHSIYQGFMNWEIAFFNGLPKIFHINQLFIVTHKLIFFSQNFSCPCLHNFSVVGRDDWINLLYRLLIAIWTMPGC